MTTMLSLILAFMLSIGGSPAASVNPSGCPGDTGVQAPDNNNRTINRFFEDYREKNASRPISKKILEIPLIKQPKTKIRLRFTLYLKEELRLMGYIDSMNLYQAFNMNPVNFLDPFGERIKFTGDQKERDFEIFKTIFNKIGIQIIDSLIELDEEGYVILKKGKGSLIKYGMIVGRNLKRRDEGGYEAWINYGTKNLKNDNNFYKMNLEALFEEIINDPRTIEFQINPDKFKEKGFIRDRIGQGIFLHPDDDLNFSKDKDPQVVTEGGGAWDVHRKIFMDPYTTIVHEFGHAYGYMKGSYDKYDHESLFAELAVMFENLYRMRSGTLDENKSIELRAHHNTRLNRNLTSWFFKITGVGVWPKMN